MIIFFFFWRKLIAGILFLIVAVEANEIRGLVRIIIIIDAHSCESLWGTSALVMRFRVIDEMLFAIHSRTGRSVNHKVGC